MSSILGLFAIFLNIGLLLLRLIYGICVTMVKFNIKFAKHITRTFRKISRRSGYRKYESIMNNRIAAGTL